MVRHLRDVFLKITIPYNEDGTINYNACFNYTGGFNKRSPVWDYRGKKLVPYLVVWELVKGSPFPEGMIALHSCDNRRCCNVWNHITPGTHEQNMQEMEERDRHGMPAHAVRFILNLLEQGTDTHEEIAAKFGCSRETITKIANGRVHKRHIQGATTERDIETIEVYPSSRQKSGREDTEG